MNIQNERICRLCLQTASQDNLEEIDEITKEMLDILRLKLNLALTDKLVICNVCVKDLQESFEFKSICLYTEDIIYPLFDSNAKVDLKDIYLKQNNVESTNISEDQKICRLCLKLMEMGFYMPLNEKLDNMFKVEDVLYKYIPELKLNATEAPIICLSCLDSVQHLSSFLMTTLKVEDKIIKYIETEGTNKKKKVKLDNVQKYFSNNEKNGGDYSTTARNIIEIEIENTSSMESEDISCEMKTEIEENITVKEESDCEGFNEGSDLEMSIKNEEIEIKSDLNDNESVDNIMPTSSKSKGCNKSSKVQKTEFICSTCSYKTFNKSHLIRHFLIHQDPSKIKMYKCEKCSFETKHERYMTKHMWCHHTDPSEIIIYKCEHCTFKSKRKEAYNKHLIYHVNPSAVKVYQCEVCEYKTLYKNTYAYHILTHKDISEVEKIFKCDKCTYESKHRQHIYRHMFIHKDPSEVKRFQCNICDYKATSKKGLGNHMVTHKDHSEVKMFKCSVCAYQSKYKYSMKSHAVTHKDASELTMYECTFCTYETKYKSSFKSHMKKTHKK